MGAGLRDEDHARIAANCKRAIKASRRNDPRRIFASQAETIRAMAPTNQFFDDGDPRRVLKAPDAPPFDWRRLLKLYMAYVLHKEGVTYVASLQAKGTLTPDERAAILEIDAEVKRENPDDAA